MSSEHAVLVRTLAKSGEEIRAGLSARDAHTLHMLLGLAGEVGELIDPLKKAIIYQQPLDIYNAVEELSDVEF